MVGSVGGLCDFPFQLFNCARICLGVCVDADLNHVQIERHFFPYLFILSAFDCSDVLKRSL